MSTNTPHPTSAARTARRFGVYYRTSNRLGAPHLPTIITVAGGTVDAVTADGTRLLYASARELTARFTVFGTLIVESRGQRFRFVTGSYAGNQARPFIAEQVRQLAEAGSAEPDDGARARSVNMNSPVGVATMFSEQRRAFLHTLALAELVDEAGAAASYTTKNYTTAVWAAAGIALPLIAVFTAAVMGLLLLIVDAMH